jgi:formylglycine-generating enzyme required for sulfatase activity
MAGNVLEWTADWYAADYYRQLAEASGDAAAINPTGPDTGEFRMLRGGSFSEGDFYVRCAVRFWNFPDYRGSAPNNGFRVVSLGS